MYKLTLTLLLYISTLNCYAQTKGHFNITTNPSSATVILTEFPDIQKITPASFNDYKPMLYRLRIERQNCIPIDTTIHCLPGRIIDYHFELEARIVTCNINSDPAGAQVYINDNKVGITPLNNYPIRCGINKIVLISPDNVKWQETFVVNEDTPFAIHHNFKWITSANNPTYSQPINVDSFDTDMDLYDTESDKSFGGFGAFGLYTMIGSNGAKGTSYRYGADLFHYLRVWGESNNESDIKGFGLEGVLPLDLDKAAFYLKGGLVSRSFEPLNTNGRQSINFATLGAGLSIKPSPHFQIFAEFEFGVYDEEEYQETIDLWENKYNSFSSGGGWIGIRVAF
jgi:hypothetical protein